MSDFGQQTRIITSWEYLSFADEYSLFASLLTMRTSIPCAEYCVQSFV